MGDIKTLLAIAISIALINNMVLGRFLGLCPFLGVSKKISSALGMGLAVIFVMTLTSIVTWVLYNYILLAGPQNVIGHFSDYVRENGLVDVLRTSVYILVIAVLVQFVEMMMKKSTPALYRALGIYLPLITTNCTILGVALLNTTDAKTPLTFLQATVQGFFGGVGFLMALLLMSGIRENLDMADVPKCLRGAPIAFIATSLMALAFMGFAGMVG
jgi:electron transport complex protein RnfA